ncbi:hypothetical protein CASFOL_040613 [Castilleja foliolosa]|uniref:Cystatin domain-containing protein n=1 Tax=Castilleja foliolosa TaxID=1961234 RepID=A0ABD3BCA9_9LAMI
MATFKSLCFPFFLTIWLTFYSIPEAAPLGGSEMIIGGWQPIKNLTDPLVVKIANFAVAEHNKQPKATKLEFVSVVKGGTQVVAGANYRLVISATESGGKSTKPEYYKTIVFEKLKDKALKLISFEKVLKM